VNLGKRTHGEVDCESIIIKGASTLRQGERKILHRNEIRKIADWIKAREQQVSSSSNEGESYEIRARRIKAIAEEELKRQDC